MAAWKSKLKGFVGRKSVFRILCYHMPHNFEHLQQNWDAAAIALTTDQMSRLDAFKQGQRNDHRILR